MTSQMPDTRQRLVVLSRDDYNRARTVSPELLVDPFTRVVALPLRSPDSEDPALLSLGNALQPRTVLLHNRWGGDYVDATEAYERFSLAKFNAFANVCQMLGAARLEVEELYEVTEDGRVSGKADLRGSAAAGGGTLSSDWSRRLAQSIKATWTWNSGSGDPGRAAAYAQAEGLKQDPIVNGLIEQHRFPGNALTEHVLELNIGSEARRAIQATLEVGTILGKLGPGFNSTFDFLRKQNRQLGLRVRVVFAPSGN